MSLISRSPTDGAGAASSLSSSAAIRSPDRCATRLDRASIAASVAGSIVEVERRREPDGADHPEGVLLEPRERVADGPQQARRDVGAAVVRVDQGRPPHRPVRPRPSR